MENQYSAVMIVSIAEVIVIGRRNRVEQEVKQLRKKPHDHRNYHRTQMQKEMVLQKLKEKGCRITKQRLVLLNIILEEECSCCKEIFYRAVEIDNRIGVATVYRMINALEEIGAISRKNMYKITCGAECEVENVCTVEFDDDTICHLSANKWNTVIHAGLSACGYINGQEIRSVIVKQCSCDKSEA